MLSFHNRIKNLIKRPAFVLFALVVLLWIISLNFHSAKAEDRAATVKSISVSPGLVQADANDGSGFTSDASAAINDLPDQAGFDDFNSDNSAHLSVGDFASLEKTVSADPAVIDVETVDASTSAELPEAIPAAVEPAPQNMVEHSLVIQDFSLATEQKVGVISNVQLRLSLAAKQLGARDQIRLAYDIGAGWQDAGVLDLKNELSNRSNNGFFLFALPTFADWDELNSLKIKVGFLGDSNGSAADIYLDAAWIEVDYSEADSGESLSASSSTGETILEAIVEEESAVADTRDFELNQISPDRVFKTNDNPDFNFVYKRKQGVIDSFVAGLFGLVSDQYSGIDIKTVIKNSRGDKIESQPEVEYLSNGEFHVRVPKRPRNFKPGRFTMEIEIIDNGAAKLVTQNFDWGVLAINTSKSVYLPTESAYLQMGVLDDSGNTICDADLFLEVTAPDGGVAYLDTYNGLVSRNPACGPNNVIDVPDYMSDYGLAGIGIYKMRLTAKTKNGDYTINDQFEVRETVSFDIERIGPTRIWPMADYEMKIKIKASSSANDFYEVIPKNFIIKKSELKLNDIALTAGSDYEFENYGDGTDGMILHWRKLAIKEGDIFELAYVFDAPDISPEFYLLGPVRIGEFEELRQWQIASDAVTIYNANNGYAVGAWVNAAQAWDSTNGNGATRTIVSGTNETTIYLRATSSNAPTSGDGISKVELGVKGQVLRTYVRGVLRPLFSGTATGSSYTVIWAAQTTDETIFTDITSDAAGPGAANWTWSTINNLDFLLHGNNTGGTSRLMTVDQLYIRVTTLSRPVNVINSVAQKNDGSGLVDFQTVVSDVDGDNSKMMIEYEAGATCAFTVPRVLFVATTGTSSTFGTFRVDNAQTYQVGSTTDTASSILTSSGANTLNFDWDTKNTGNGTDLTSANGTYCVRVTANDGTNDATPASMTLTLDNVKPTAPGNLSLATTSAGTDIDITYGSVATDTNFKEYKIFYKVGTSSVTEADQVLASSTIDALGFANFNNSTSTVLADLLPRTDYVFVIYAYDQYGNKSSSSEVTIQTEKAASVRANTVSYFGGQWTTTDGTSGQLSDTDQTLASFDFALAETGAQIKNAYILFEANYNSYLNTAGDYTGYKLAFDSCTEPCTANAFTGTGRVLTYDTSVLSYRSGTAGVNTARLLLDVTNEAQLAAYRGDGQLLQGQIGYRLERGGATTSISAVKAKLIVTYKYYDTLSTNFTNTVVYPLESGRTGDTGTTRAGQTDDCAKGTNATGTCPIFYYAMTLPEYKASSSQWFETYNVNAGNTATDITVTANIQGTDIDIANAYIHEAALGGSQGSLPVVYLAGVPGFSENSNQQLEYRPANSAGSNTYYLLGGEVYETYFASTSASTKTRTVSYPLGIISTTSPTVKTGQSVSVYFPENGGSAGVVTIKKAWLRIKGNYYNTTARTFIVSTKVGSNAESAAATYNLLMTTIAPKSAFTIIHVIPSSDYALLQASNGLSSTSVSAYTTVSNASVGGTSAELMITYAYSDEVNGRLSSLNVYGGQSYMNGNAKLATTSGLTLVFPEAAANKTILAGAMLSQYSISDSGGAVASANHLLGANLSTSTIPVCTNAFVARPDNVNGFFEFYKNVTSALGVVNNQAFTTCYSTDGAGGANTGAKMNSQLYYTYRYDPPSAQLSQNNWRWYANDDTLEATTSLGGEAGQVSNINIADVIRLRLNVGLQTENMSTSSQTFKLQFGSSTDCASIAPAGWSDVGTTTSNVIWRSYDNANVGDGSSTGAALLSDSTRFESYEENNPTAANPAGLIEGESGEWDWVVYNNGASSSQSYCFRMVYDSGAVLSNYASYPILVTAASNTPPINPFSLSQFKNTTTTLVTNGGWLNENAIRLAASTTDVNVDERLWLFFELATSTSLRTATTVPTGVCAPGTAWAGCASRVWSATSTVGDYRTTPFSTTTSIITLAEDYNSGYKWQALACDSRNVCSDWTAFGGAPNFKVDLTNPAVPDPLSFVASTGVSMTLKLSTTTEDNFFGYKIYYKIGTTSPTENNYLWTDANFSDLNFNGATTTEITGLTANTVYAFNIWAFDLAGNKASSTSMVATTAATYNPPTGVLNNSIGQRLDGSGAIIVSATFDDPDNDNTLRARIEYEAGNTCLFASASTTVLNPASTTITATNLPKPVIDNSDYYQLGSSSAYIITSPGPNTVNFDWLSRSNFDNVQGYYCLRMVTNDGGYDSVISTRTYYIDNINPTAPGALTENSVAATSIILNYGTPSVESHFGHYAIYYGLASPLSEADMSHSDANLSDKNFNNAATTTITGLLPDTTYYFAIWAYDYYGNFSSSTELAVKTNAYPINPSNLGQYKADGITAIANGSWATEDTVKLVASTSDHDAGEVLSLYFELLASTSSFTVATTVPVSACSSTVNYLDCSSHIWLATSTANPFVATATIASIPTSTIGYKWQVLACDKMGECSEWSKFNLAAPNFKIDTVVPTAPGPFTLNAKTSVSVTLNFGATTTETNFFRYRLFYSTSSTSTKETDFEKTDTNLNDINYNGASMITVASLRASTTYYFNLWAYDLAGQVASSTRVAVTTNQVQSTPGVLFYAKNSRSLFYRLWNGIEWGVEQAGPTLGSAAGDNIRHISVLSSDDRGKIAILAKTWDGTNQEWYGTVFRVASNDFVNTSILGTALNSVNGSTQISGCVGALSGGEFFVIRNNNATGNPSTQVYSWTAAGGWVSQGNPASLNAGSQLYGGCQLVRRVGTDNYLLITQDNRSGVGTAYYTGTSTYSNSWVSWAQQTANSEYSVNNYVGEGFFDATVNTRGAFYTGTASTTAVVLGATRFTNTDSGITIGGRVSSPNGADAWSARAVQGEFSQDPGAVGIAYFAGRDTANQLNVYKLDITNTTPAWSAVTNGKYVNTPTAMYDVVNYSQKPFALNFYQFNKALVTWTLNTAGAPRYKKLDSLANTIEAASSTVPGASTTATWVRSRLYQDPNDVGTLAVYQNTAKDYGAIFWNGDVESFYTTGSSSWFDIASSSGVSSANDSATAFSFASGNSAPNAPINLAQYKIGGTTAIANGDWTSQDTVVLRLAAKDPDTSEIIKLYLELIGSDASFTTADTVPASPCASTTAYNDCISKIWQISTSTLGDYSATPFTATATITGLPDNTLIPGYKWQVLACDDSDACSGWGVFNATQPNFKVDTTRPTDPGDLTVVGKTSNSVVLQFGAQTTEANFVRYQISYSTTSPVTVNSASSTDGNLGYINFNNFSTTTISGLASSTLYYFRIWAFDAAGNVASSVVQTSATTNVGPIIYQTSFVFENDDGVGVNNNSTSTAASTTLSNLNRGERFGVRIQIENRGGDAMLSKAYKLQFSTSTIWYDVGASTPIAYSPGLSGVNGAALTGYKASSSPYVWADGSWHQSTNVTGATTLNNGYFSEFTFMLQDILAIAGTGYNFRLYNNTDNAALGSYLNYPRVTVNATNSLRFSKGTYASLPSSYGDLTYFLDRKGYNDVSSDDNILRDISTSSANYPILNFIIRNSTNTQAITGRWNGQSSVAATSKPVYLQVFRFGSTNAWVTMASSASAAADIDFSLTGTVNASLSEYYDALYFAYWRVYQESGTETIRTDEATSTFSTPTPDVSQKHYRFYLNNGGESAATAMAAEDTATTTDQGAVVRIRMSAVNLGAGDAANYQYQLEYATTSAGCAYDVGTWMTVPSTTNKTLEFRMATSSFFNDQASTTQRLANSEGYTFGAPTTAGAGHMVSSSSNKTLNNTLRERYYVENEYAIMASTSAVAGATYCFRMTNNGTPLNSYALGGVNNFAELTIAGATNATPAFTVNPKDNPLVGGSGTSSPTNEGSQVDFTATAHDNDGDDYYLAVCQGPGINPGNNGAPTCRFGTWCVSGSAVSDVESTCSYTVATTTEIANWYAYVCDGRAGTGVAKCSAYSQGGWGTDEDAPFFVNHRPTFSAVTTITGTTTPPPGWTYTIQTTSADTDTVDGNDTLTVFVCTTNSASEAGCTGGIPNTVCADTVSASSTNVSCPLTTPVPSTDGSFTYYAFVYDSHGLNASSNSRSSSYSISNVAPTFGTIFLNNGSSIQLNLRGDVDKPVPYTVQVSDLNGCSDINSTVGKLYMTGTTSSCTVNNNTCYAAVSPTNCGLSGCLVGGTTATYTCTVNMKYYAVSTDAANASTSAYQWKANFNVYDFYGNLTAGSSTGVELITGTGLDITQPTINFGLLNSSATSTGLTNQQTTIVNAANSPINTNLYGTDMFGDLGGGSIGVNYLRWQLNSTFNYIDGISLTDFSNSVDVPAHILKTTTAADSSKNFYWGLGLPAGLYSAAYTGSTTFTAIVDNESWSW